MRRRQLLSIVAFFHLLLVALGAGYFPFEKLGAPGELLQRYGAATGAINGFGFFVTDAEDHVYARFAAIDAEGRRRPVRLESGRSHESDLRIGAIADNFYMPDKDGARFQRSLAASLAGTLFGRHPDAKEVVVTLEKFTPVSMQAYRAGARPHWSSVYEVHFTAPRSGT